MVNESIPPADEEDNRSIRNMNLASVMPKLEKPWIFYRHLVLLNFMMLSGILGHVVSGYDGSMMNGLQSVPSWREYFDNPSGGRLGTMSVGVTVGTLIVVPFVSYVCEYLGRRWTVVLGGLISILGAVIQGVSQNFSMFIAGRIIIGIGTPFSGVAGALLLAECTYPTHRATVTSFFQASWSFGSFIAALVTWGCYNSASMKETTWAWRIPSLLQGALPILQSLIAIIGPESPRFLVSKDKIEEAEEFFIKYQAGGDRDSLLVKYQMAEVLATIEAEKLQKQSRWMEWFRTKPMLHRLFLVIALPIMMQLLGNAIISYYLHIVLNNIGIKEATTQLKINIGLNAWGNICSIVAASVVWRFKRKHMILTGYSLMCVVYMIFTILSALNQKSNFTNKSYGVGIVAMIYLFQGFYHISSPISITYTTEITPFSLRAKGQTIVNLANGVVGLFNNYVNPIAMEAIQWRYYIVWTCWIAVQCCIVILFFPETHGLALEEIAQVFGDELVDTDHTVHKVMEQDEQDHGHPRSTEQKHV